MYRGFIFVENTISNLPKVPRAKFLTGDTLVLLAYASLAAVNAGTSKKKLIFYKHWFCIFSITDWYNTAIKQQFHKYFAFFSSNEVIAVWNRLLMTLDKYLFCRKSSLSLEIIKVAMHNIMQAATKYDRLIASSAKVIIMNLQILNGHIP